MAGVELDHHRDGAGDPLVLIHGVGHTWRAWKPMLPLLEERFDVLAVDLPGFGYSPELPAGVESSPENLADAVERAMYAAGFRPPTSQATLSAAGSPWSWRGAGAPPRSRRSRRRA